MDNRNFTTGSQQGGATDTERTEWNAELVKRLPSNVVDALTVFSAVTRRQMDSTDWYAMCTTTTKASAFFKGPANSVMHRRQVSEIAAKAYISFLDGLEPAVVKPAMIFKLRACAKDVRDNLPASKFLPRAADTTEFRAGLEALCGCPLPTLAARNNSGDPRRRMVIKNMAKGFAKAFTTIPVDFIHDLVRLGWPDASHSATKRVLTASVMAAIKKEAEAEKRLEDGARTTATLAIGLAASKRRILSAQEQDIVEVLQKQIDRIQSGKRQFPTDLDRLTALRQIAGDLDDRQLSEELVRHADISLKEFVG